MTGCWGLKSYENDDAHDALDRGFERVHGAVYDDLMDDGDPTPIEEIQKRLASPETLAAALDLFEFEAGSNRDRWDDLDRLGFAGIIVRHVELGVAVPDDLKATAAAFLEAEDLEWDEPTKRNLRREKEIAMLRRG